MSVKSSVLKKLEENRGNYFSGEALAEELQVTRASVWKAVKQLEQEGYEILAVQNRGYCLAEYADHLSKEGILAYLPKEQSGLDIHVVRQIRLQNRRQQVERRKDSCLSQMFRQRGAGAGDEVFSLFQAE